jgi:hypothetical protein
MKISKNNSQRTSSTVQAKKVVRQQSQKVTAAAGGRDEAVEYIQSAIHSLGCNSRDDIIAKEAIANLSVILMDLKSS